MSMRIVLVVELDPDAPLQYAEELTDHLRGLRWVENVRWQVIEDE